MRKSPVLLAALSLMTTSLITTVVAAALPDPTRPASLPGGSSAVTTVTKPAEASLRLHYILYSRDRRVASIGNQLLVEGQQIKGWTLLTINSDHIILSHGKRRRMLRIFADNDITVPEEQPAQGVHKNAP